MLDMIFALFLVFALLALVYWATHRWAAATGIPAPILTAVDLTLVGVFVLVLLRVTGIWSRVSGVLG